MLDTITGQFGAILVDPPWRFQNRSGKIAPEHKRLYRYETMATDEIAALPVGELGAKKSHCWLWCPNAILPEALEVLKAWGFTYKTNLVWMKVTKAGQPDRRPCGFYMRNTTEMLLLGVRGSIRTRGPYNQPNVILARTRGHSRKPDEVYELIERRSHGPWLELFARYKRANWTQWGNQLGKLPEFDGYETGQLFDCDRGVTYE